jgi:acetylglutamate kinase/acetylornithine deacetylase
MRPLYVVKLGSATLSRPSIFGELAELVARGARVLAVTGGATGIEQHYRTAGRPMPELRLANGDVIRGCPAEEMAHIIAAYEQVTMPAMRAGLEEHRLSVFTSIAATGALVTGTPNRPLRAITADGRSTVVRDHRVGLPEHVDVRRLRVLLDSHDVVCLSPPIATSDGGTALNVDADVLAAALSNALEADHLRLVTGTAGLLADPADAGSTLPDLHAGEGHDFAGGRMRQKVRAAELALAGSADVAITGPHTLTDLRSWTRFWRTREPAADLRLLSRAVGIPSVSEDEHELARYLRGWCQQAGIEAEIDVAGNLVAVRGEGPRRLMLLGHLDTVPAPWPVRWDGDVLSGRGSVDAKGCLVSFLEVLASADIPAGCQLRVVGAVEEEISSSKGAFHVRDHYPADAVIVGEPSGSGTLTLGYFGLFKLRVRATVRSGHSASMDAVSAPDVLIRTLEGIRESVGKDCADALGSVIDIRCEAGRDHQQASGVLNFRVPPGADLEMLRATVLDHARDDIEIELLRMTPGFAGKRSTSLVKAFGRAFERAEIRPRYVVKKGTSDMNTLATTWHDVPMVAYGPGDSTLDHTSAERIEGVQFRLARDVLTHAVETWFSLAPGGAR